MASNAQTKPRVATPDTVNASRRRKLLLIGAAAAGLIALYLFLNIRGDWQYALSRRLTVIGAVILTGGATAAAAVIFQTLTHNRILTPSIIGLDSLYVLMQTVVVFALGATSKAWTDATTHFFLSAGLLALFGTWLYERLFATEKHNIYTILLIGLISGTLFQSLASFLQMLIDPNEFLIVQNRLFASFNNISPRLLGIGAAALALIALYVRPYVKYLDVFALGKDHAINLGVDYNRIVKPLWTTVILLTAVATALVGPITFLGLLVVNVAYELLADYRHSVLLGGSALLAIGVLAGGLVVVERVFALAVPVSVIINFAGGAYFLHLVLKESQS